MRNLIILLAIVTCMAGCITPARMAKICATCPTRTMVKDSVTMVTETIIRDSLITLPADSAWYRLWLQCDSSGKVQVVKSETVSGSRTTINYAVQDNVLRTDCKIDSAKVTLQWLQHNTVKTTQRAEVKTIQVTVPAKLTRFQSFMLATGKTTWLLIALALALYAAYLLYSKYVNHG